MPCYIPREYMYLDILPDILHVFYTYPERVQDTCWDTYEIHQDTCIVHVGYMRDLCGIHMRYMYLQRFEDTWRIHAGYMRDT